MARKRLLVYSPLAIWQPPIYETQLEIVQDYVDEGYDATILTCHAHLPTCEANPRHLWSVCTLCRSRAKSGFEWLRGQFSVTDFFDVTPGQQKRIDTIVRTPFRTLEELRSLSVDGSDIGMAVLSSVVSALRDPNPDLDANRAGIVEGIRAAAVVHFSILNHIARLRPDVLLLFNGRVASLRPALRAGQASGVRTVVYEVGGSPDRYFTTTNTYPHDLATLKDVFNAAFDEATESPEEKAQIADSWYKARIASRPADGMSFTGKQEAGRIPERLQSDGLRVGIFISSEDEFVAIDGWKPPLYVNQADGIRQLLAAFADCTGVQFVLRVHPNLAGLDNAQTRELAVIAQDYPDLYVIEASSPVHTYSLIEAVDIVVTFGSTVAIEAVYLGKPSIMLGRHIFEDMGGVIRPPTHEELVAIIRDAIGGKPVDVQAGAKQAAIRFGFAQSRVGVPYRYVVRDGADRAVLIRDGHSHRLRYSLTARLVTAPARAIRRLTNSVAPKHFTRSSDI